MHKIKLILLLILPISVFAQDLGIIDTRTTKNPALNGTYRISTDGKNLFFRNFIGISEKVANTDSATFTGLITLPSTTSIGNVSSTELSYLDGVTSSIQTQLNSKQTLNGTGFVKASGTTISYDNSTYLTTSSASSTYAPIASPTFTGTVSGITKSMVGLGNVDNTTDANKPISTATQTALDAKQATLNGTGFVKSTAGTISYDNSTYLTTSTAASTYLPISNPTATGTLTAPTIANTLGANFATTSGNVGIGTASPLTRLHVKWTGANNDGLYTPSIIATDGKTIGDGIGLAFYGHNSGNNEKNYGSLNYFITNPTTGAESSELTIRTLNGGSTGDRIKLTSSGNTLIGTTTDAGYKLDVNGTARVTGNVSIGTTLNTRTLQVHTTTNNVNFEAANNTTTGTNYGTSSYAFGVGATINVGGLFQASGATTNYGIRVFNVAASANNYAIYSDSPAQSYFQGNVGIGTTSPNSVLHTIGTIQTSSTSSASSNYANRFNNIVFSRFDIPTTYTNVISNSWSGTTTDQTMNFEIGSGASTRVTAMTLLGNGNVGIGTTAPASKLHISGAGDNTFKIASTATNNPYLNLTLQNTGSTPYGVLEVGDGVAYRALALNPTSGNVGIGTGTTAPAYKLDVNGSFNANSIYTKDNQSGYAGNYGRYSVAYPYATFSTSGAWGYDWQVNGSSKMTMSSSGNIGIGTSTPAATALLDITSTTQGVLFPRMTTAQINAIASPANGLTVYNTTLLVLCFYDGTGWRKVSHTNM